MEDGKELYLYLSALIFMGLFISLQEIRLFVHNLE